MCSCWVPRNMCGLPSRPPGSIAGRPVYTAELQASLREFIRRALDPDPIPDDLRIPSQGPARPSSPRPAAPAARAAEDRVEAAAGVPVVAWEWAWAAWE